jgi:hypothetical protein
MLEQTIQRLITLISINVQLFRLRPDTLTEFSIMSSQAQPHEKDDEYFSLPAANPRVETFLPAAQPKPGLYWVFPTRPSGALYLHRLTPLTSPKPALKLLHHMPTSDIQNLTSDIQHSISRFSSSALDVRQEPAPGYRDTSTQTATVDIDPTVLKLDTNSKFEDTYFEIDRSTEWLPPRPRNPGLRMASLVHYGPVSISSSDGTRRSPVAFTPSIRSAASIDEAVEQPKKRPKINPIEETEGQSKRGWWDRLMVSLWMAYGNRPYM